MRSRISSFFIVAITAGVSFPCFSADLTVVNWNDYIDPDTLVAYERETGNHVNYSTFDSADEMLGLISGSNPIDVVGVPLDLASGMIERNSIAPYSAANLSGMAHVPLPIIARVRTQDPHVSYVAPYLWGRVGITVNRPVAEAALGAKFNNSWDNVFLADKASKLSACGISILDADDYVFAIYSNFKGELTEHMSPRTTRRVLGQLQGLRHFYKDINSVSYLDDFKNGSVCVAVSWEGDGLKLAEENPNIEFLLPAEGTVMFIDTLAIAEKSTHKEAAKQFIEFMTRPEISAKNAAYTGYNSPNSTSKGQTVAARIGKTPTFMTREVSSGVEAEMSVGWSRFVGPAEQIAGQSRQIQNTQ